MTVTADLLNKYQTYTQSDTGITWNKQLSFLMRKHLTKTNDKTADYLTWQGVLIRLACHLNFSHVPNRQTPLKLWTYCHVRSTTLRTSWSGKMYHHAMVIFSCTQKWCAENSGEETKKWRMNMVIQTKLPVALLPPNYAVKVKTTLFTEGTQKVMPSEKNVCLIN